MSNPDGQSIRLLNTLYSSAQAQSNMINAMIIKADDDAMKTGLSQHLHKFRALESDISRAIRNRDGVVAETSRFKNALELTSAKLKLSASKSPEKIARVLSGYTNRYNDSVSGTVAVQNSCDSQVHILARKLDHARKELCNSLKSYM